MIAATRRMVSGVGGTVGGMKQVSGVGHFVLEGENGGSPGAIRSIKTPMDSGIFAGVAAGRERKNS